jgi:hypothetical protein
MVCYNVTVQIDPMVSADWMDWMKKIHIPEVMNTGKFVSARMYRLNDDEQTAPTFVMQYTCLTMKDLEHYQKHFAPKLQEEHKLRYADKYVAFRTVMQQEEVWLSEHEKA